MFSLTQDLPERLDIRGINYDLNLSFDNVLLMFEMFDDKEIEDVQKPIVALEMLIKGFKNVEFDSIEELFSMYEYVMKEFLDIDVSNKEKEDEVGNNTTNSKKVFDYKKDSKLIYSSFLNYYHIDLIDQRGKMHWNKFQALLDTMIMLGEDTPFNTVISYRNTKIPKATQHNKDEIKRIRAMKKIYKLEEEQIKEFDNMSEAKGQAINSMDALANIFKKEITKND